MEWALAVIAGALIVVGAVSRRVDGTPITPAIIFVGIGLLVGTKALDLVDAAPNGESVRFLAEATLAVVLFADASRIDLQRLRQEYAVPARLLGLGLPLTIALGTVIGAALFGALTLAEALVLAVLLAPTDAALGQAVVTEPRLPSRIRQGLNVESGLNDGICVPLLFIVLAIAEAEDGRIGAAHAFRVVGEEIGWGIAGGLLAGAAIAAAIRFSVPRGLIENSWLQILPVAGAALAYGIAAPLGGSGFIAAFVAGMTFGALRGRAESGEIGFFTDQLGELLSGVTFLVFGAVLLWPALADLSWRIGLYAVASLTVVRMLPVAAAMLGTHARPRTVAFLGWFGPRGLASIVFAVIVVEKADLPHATTIVLTTYVTVGLRHRPRRYGSASRRPLCRLVRLAPTRAKAGHGKCPCRDATLATAGSTVSMEALLLTWYRHFGRDLPWRHTTDPYAILVSEVMLQQTQVARVIPRYLGWLERWPSANALADASAGDVIRAWQGLGYDRRALALQRAAQAVARDGWPEDLTTLPGIGPYTAAAVRNSAFGEDVLPSRNVSVDRIERRTRHRFTGASAQALMDLGATICLARVPRCEACPLANVCPSRGSRDTAARKQSRVRGLVPPAACCHPAPRGRRRGTIGRSSGREAVNALAKDGLVVIFPDGTVTLP